MAAPTVACLDQNALGLITGLRRSRLVDGTHTEFVLESLREVRHAALALRARDIYSLLPLGAAKKETKRENVCSIEHRDYEVVSSVEVWRLMQSVASTLRYSDFDVQEH